MLSFNLNVTQPSKLIRYHCLQGLMTLMLFCSYQALGSSENRLITAGGSITEVVYALGKGDQIVATDSTSMYPEPASRLPKIGYFRQIGTESILSFSPTHLIGAAATGPQGMLEQLTEIGVTVHILGEDKSLPGLQALILQVGQLLNTESKARQLITNIQSDVEQLQETAKNTIQHHNVTALYVLSSGDRGLTVAGSNTVPQALFDALGIHNAAEPLDGYKVMDNEAIVAANPDIIFLASHRFPADTNHNQICQHPALVATNAARTCNVHTLDSSKSLGLSPRFPEAMEEILSLSTEVLATTASLVK
ncbi:MAG: hemin ABC transporter substrate-binding protein [Aestuariibacter sp.]